MIKEFKLFKVKNDSMMFPTFYVTATDILEATKIAKEIVDSLKNDRVIGIVSEVDAPFLEWEEE